MTTIYRAELQDRCTGRWIMPDGYEVKTLERENLGNQINISCIPYGIYQFEIDEHGKHQWFKINDVDGRTAIEIHEGYKPEHSNGCILCSLTDLKMMREKWFNEVGVKYVLEIVKDE